jgi:hypothetical protein
MNDNDIYQSWVESRRNSASASNLSEKVVAQILQDQRARRAKQQKRKWAIDRWLEWISLRPLMQTAMILAACVAGALRLVWILQIVFPF